MKYKGTRCDICGAELGGGFQYKFRYWHWRTGTIHVQHMCQSCIDKFKEFVKCSEEKKDEQER